MLRTRFFGTTPILVVAFLIILLVSFGVYQPIFEPPYIILVLNIIFITISSLIVAGISARSYMSGGPTNVLLLGSSMLIFATVAIVAGFGIFKSNNTNVTIYNSSALASSILQLANAILIYGSRPQVKEINRSLRLLVGYTAPFIIVGFITWLTLNGLTPPFFVPGTGGTPLRNAILALTVLFFALSSILLMAQALRSNSNIVYWYSLGLALFALGLLAVLLQHNVADPVGWTGKAGQYIGGLYFIVSVIAAYKQARSEAT